MDSKDELADVCLDGIRLVSDNPSDWNIPHSAYRYESALSWWESLIENDADQNHGMSREQHDRLLDLAYEYESLQSEAFDGQSTVPHMTKIRSVVQEICRSGLTPKQVALFLATSEHQIMSDLYCNQLLGYADLAIRLYAENMLRHGSTVGDVCAETGLSRDQVTTLANTFSLTPASARPDDYPQEIKDRVIQYRLNGMTNREISDLLAAEDVQVKPATISKWWGRYQAKGN